MRLGKIAGYLFPQYREATTCPACNQPFTCGATLLGCWCTKIKLSAEIREQLRQNYQGCLCQRCLEDFASTDCKQVDL
jgi:hypothetical protein